MLAVCLSWTIFHNDFTISASVTCYTVMTLMYSSRAGVVPQKLAAIRQRLAVSKTCLLHAVPRRFCSAAPLSDSFLILVNKDIPLAQREVVAAVVSFVIVPHICVLNEPVVEVLYRVQGMVVLPLLIEVSALTNCSPKQIDGTNLTA